MEKEKNNYPEQIYYPYSLKPKRIGKDEAMSFSDIMEDPKLKAINENFDKPMAPDEIAYRLAKMKSFFGYQHAINNKPIPEKYRNEPSPNGMKPIQDNQMAQREVETDIDFYRYINDMFGYRTQEERDQLYDEYQQMMAEDKYIFEQEIYQAKAEDLQNTYENQRDEDILNEFVVIRHEAEGIEIDDLEF